MTQSSRINRIGPLPVKRRQLHVKAIQDLTPRLRLITLTGEELAGFHSPGADDHVKLFFPAPEGEPALRDYTPRAHRPEAGELDILFVLHGDGPGTTWAANARVGDPLIIGGPRGSTQVTYTFDWYLLVGDEAALPAIARRLEELPAQAEVTVVLEVDNVMDQVPLRSAARLKEHWVHRHGAAPGTTTLLLEAVRALILPEGDGYVWVGAERAVAAQFREHLLEERGMNRDHVRVSAYWTRGEVAN